LLDAGILGGVKLGDGILFAVTEKRTKEEIDNLVNIAAL
jgi:glycine dehydrogenase subunit 1